MLRANAFEVPRDLVESLVPANTLPTARCAPHRMLEPVLVVMNVLQGDGLRADVAATEHIVVIAVDGQSLVRLDLDLDPADRLAKITGAVVGRVTHGFIHRLHRLPRSTKEKLNPCNLWIALDSLLALKYLDIKIIMSRRKLEPLTNGTGVHVFLVMWKAVNAVETYAQRSIAELEMCGSDFAVLEALLHKGPLPINELGRKVLLTSGSITVAVDRLESKGLVERRAKIVHLTKAGKDLIARVYAGHAADMEQLASASLTKAERETLIRLLKKIGYEAAGRSEQLREE